jgi:hypothetical protein
MAEYNFGRLGIFDTGTLIVFFLMVACLLFGALDLAGIIKV